MAKKLIKRKCRSCKAFFYPDPRNAWHQVFCSKPECRKKSKASSHSRWLAKPDNQDYFKGPHHVRRVQRWRKAHPGYWRKRSCKPRALQDHLNGEPLKKQSVESHLASHALQDCLKAQPVVLIGLIAHLAGSALQDDIAKTARRLRQLGNDVLNLKGGGHDTKTPHISPQGPKGPQTVQLGGSPSGS